MAIVNIWYPTLKSTKEKNIKGLDTSSAQNIAYSLLDNVGHASLTLDNAQSYISWWPNEDHSGYSAPTYDWDVNEEGSNPTVRIRLNCLNEHNIRSWWERVKLDGCAIPYNPSFHPAEAKWTLSRNNCSHIVWLALKVGGAEEHATLARWGCKMITPPQIHAYAMRIRASVALKNVF